jgi:protein-S-isoprenylcysteine O-methyltransferase Ste14
MKEFDPFGWLEQYFSAKTLHVLIRLSIILLLLAFLIHRIYVYGRYLVKPLWAVETLVFIVFLISYIVRRDPIHRSHGAKEIIIPLIGGVLPFFLLFSPPNPFITARAVNLYVIFYGMTAATALTVWGLWTLRRSFSITVEARELITGGPYRFIRHPVYLGEMLSALAVTILRFSLLSGVLFIVFVAIQLCRSKMEETKLAQVFPAYSGYASGALWFWPRKK